MTKTPAYSSQKELLFILALIFVLVIGGYQSLLGIQYTMMGASLAVISAVLLIAIKKRVILAWHGATSALTSDKPVTIQDLDR